MFWWQNQLTCLCSTINGFCYEHCYQLAYLLMFLLWTLFSIGKHVDGFYYELCKHWYFFIGLIEQVGFWMWISLIYLCPCFIMIRSCRVICLCLGYKMWFLCMMNCLCTRFKSFIVFWMWIVQQSIVQVLNWSIKCKLSRSTWSLWIKYLQMWTV